MSRALVPTAVAIVSFPLLAYVASQYISSPTIRALLATYIGPICPSTPQYLPPFRITYTGHQKVDQIVCFLTSFFTLAMRPDEIGLRLYTAELLAALQAVLVIILLDAATRFKSTTISIVVPAFAGVMAQLGGGAVIYPIYFCFTQLVPSSSAVGVRDARRSEAAVFGMLVGCVVPTMAMFFRDNIYATALWQAYPILVGILQALYLSVRPWSTKPSQSHAANYIGSFLVMAFSLIVHIANIRQYPGTIWNFLQLYIPSLVEPAQTTGSAYEGILYFFRWDGFFIFFDTYLFGLLITPNLNPLDVIGAVLWIWIGSAALGFGGSLGGLWMWREIRKSKAAAAGVPKDKRQ